MNNTKYQAAISATLEAKVAIKAAKMRVIVGAEASRRYAINRGCSMAAYRLACQLEAVA